MIVIGRPRLHEEVVYLWVIRKDRFGYWLVSMWDGEPFRLDPDEWHISPDLNQGKPVRRVIGNGQKAQYFRFERKAAA